MELARPKPVVLSCIAAILILFSLTTAVLAATTQGNINALVAAGKCGTVLQGMAMERCDGIMAWNRPYEGDAVKDCYGYSRQVWNAILFDGSTHPEDYTNYSYTIANKWLGISGGIPVGTYPDSNWASISSLGGVSSLLPGDLCGTTQGHRWGMDVHYGIYAGKNASGANMCYQCGGGYDGAYLTPWYSGWTWYYKPLHMALATSPTPPPPPAGTFILDNTNATFTGTWTTGTMSTDKYGADYNFAYVQPAENATATWRPNLDKSGCYDVFVWYPQGSNRSPVAPYKVVGKDSSVTISVNQVSGGGTWNRIAPSMPFLAGTSGYVTLGNGTGETTGVVIADAIKFVFVADLDTTQPTITSVNCTPSVVAAGHPVRVTVSATDNVGVTGVTANGIALTQGPANVWTGSITAKTTAGTCPVIVVASDAAHNSRTNSLSIYRTASVLGVSAKTLLDDKAIALTAGKYLFKTWGVANSVDANGFVLLDGGRAINVSCPNHGLAASDYATVCGIYDPATGTISCEADQVRKITP